MKIYTARSVFNGPKFWEEGQYGPYYSLMIELPKDAPGVKHDEEWNRYQAYLNFDPDDPDADRLKDIRRGEELQVVWTGKSYKPALAPRESAQENDNITKLSETTSVGRTSESSSVFQLTNPTLIELGYEYLAWKTANRILATFEQVAGDERAAALTSDEQLRVAISGVIQANRDASRELAGAIESAERWAIEGVDPEGLPGSLLSEIARLLPDKYGSDKEVAEELKNLGLSSKDIDPDDVNSWYELYQIAKSVEGEAEEVVAETEASDLFDAEEETPF